MKYSVLGSFSDDRVVAGQTRPSNTRGVIQKYKKEQLTKQGHPDYVPALYQLHTH